MAYKIKKTRVKFVNLPFYPAPTEVVYMADSHDAVIEQYIRDNFELIDEMIGNDRFIYLPTIYNKMDEEVMEYNAPYAPIYSGIGSNALFDYLANPADRQKLPHCFLRYNDSEDTSERGIYIFDGYTFCIDGPEDADSMFADLSRRFDDYRLAMANVMEESYESELKDIHFSRFEDIYKSEEERIADKEKAEVKRMMDDVIDKVERLRQYGVSEWALRQLIEPERRLSHLVVTTDMQLLLPDYNNMKIVMEPLVMAVYLLFLRHPEGIVFKALPDYRDELTHIYKSVCARRGESSGPLTSRQQRAIDNVLNPLKNSINEKCTRIRAIFLSNFAEYLATDYCITGQRGEPKRIMLPREMVKFVEE